MSLDPELRHYLERIVASLPVADPAPVEGSGSGRPAEPLSDERPTNQPPMTVDDIVTRAAEVMIEHSRTSIEGCHCGWSDLGKSHAEHVARALAGAGLLATDEVKAEVWEEGCVAGESNTRIVSGDPDSNPYERSDNADA